MLANVYFDGFNLFYGSLKGTPYKWLDLDALARTMLPATGSTGSATSPPGSPPGPTTLGPTCGRPLELFSSKTLCTCERSARSHTSTSIWAASAKRSPGCRWPIRTRRPEDRRGDQNGGEENGRQLRLPSAHRRLRAGQRRCGSDHRRLRSRGADSPAAPEVRDADRHHQPAQNPPVRPRPAQCTTGFRRTNQGGRPAQLSVPRPAQRTFEER
jgi:hypothetical protein